MKKNNRHTAFLVSFLCGLVSFMFGCQSFLWNSRGNGSEQNSRAALEDDLFDPTQRTIPILGLSSDDYLGVSSKGSPIQWQPILMPLRKGLELRDRNFVLGVGDASGAIEGGLPDDGQCRQLSNASTVPPTQNPSDAPSAVEVELQNPSGQQHRGAGGQLFLVHDQLTRFVRAIGFFSKEGRATCALPAGRWLVSTGFGEARSHRSFIVTKNRSTRITLRTLERARLKIQINKSTGLQFGDLLRIGRVQAQQPALQSTGELPEVPITVVDDLMRGVLSPSDNGGIREYLFTSLILQRPEFLTLIEPGEYVIGIWRNGFMHRCVSKLFIQAGEDLTLKCETSDEMTAENGIDNEQQYEQAKKSDPDLKSITFDGSFMPSRLLSQQTFRAWMARNGVNRFIRAARYIDSQQQFIQFLLQPLLQTFSEEKIASPDGPFSGDFRLSQKTEAINQSNRPTFSRLLTAQSGINIEGFLDRFFKNGGYNSLPLAGVSERGLLEGVVPLTFRTTFRKSVNRILRPEESELFVSNGAIIEWLDPQPAITGNPIKLGSQQRIRVRLTVPPEDTTEFLTLFINGEQYKQWKVPNSQRRLTKRVLEIDEKIQQNNDFQISFAAWGKNYLPEFMFGIKQLPALSFTRIYCVDMNENSVCDR